MGASQRVAIDDNFSLVRDARRNLMAGRIFLPAAIVLVVGAVVVAIAGDDPVSLIALPLVAVVYADLRAARPKIEPTAAISASDPYVEIGPAGLRLHHPVLAEDLVLDYADIQACDVHPTSSRWRTDELQFSLRRPAGTRHPLDEPPSFLGVPEGAGKMPVPLLSLDLNLWVPNVVLVLREPTSLRALTPPGRERGWVPPREYARRRPFGGAPFQLTNTWRTMACTGLYVRVVDTSALAEALSRAGVRDRLNCHDWARATGLPHPGLDAVPADF